MGYAIKTAETVVNDALTQMLVDALVQPEQGERTVQTLEYSLDPEIPADMALLSRINPLRDALAVAEKDYADAIETGDKEASNTASQAVIKISAAIDGYLASGFGYMTRANGKDVVLKGSFLDQVFKSVKTLNGRPVWLKGDTILVNAVDYKTLKLNVVRQSKAITRTKHARPTQAAVLAEMDKRNEYIVDLSK
jgi:hypothetical protein